jgi:hypothetical protein
MINKARILKSSDGRQLHITGLCFRGSLNSGPGSAEKGEASQLDQPSDAVTASALKQPNLLDLPHNYNIVQHIIYLIDKVCAFIISSKRVKGTTLLSMTLPTRGPGCQLLYPCHQRSKTVHFFYFSPNCF